MCVGKPGALGPKPVSRLLRPWNLEGCNPATTRVGTRARLGLTRSVTRRFHMLCERGGKGEEVRNRSAQNV